MLTATAYTTALAPTNPRRDALRAARTSPDVVVFTDPTDGTQLISITDAATLVGVKPRAVYRWIKEGRVRHRKLAGYRMRVVLDSLWVNA